jgi:2-polyprenyl-6-methoxyphenol hydroxylase-like FAD-dependent oxidoreductase
MAKQKLVIVGGGPVGLLTAIMIMKQSRLKSQFDVTVVELRAGYTRKQIILLDNHSHQLLPREVRTALWGRQRRVGCYVFPPPKKTGATCYRTKLPLSSAPMYRLERALFTSARKAGVRTIRPSKKGAKLTLKFDNDTKTITIVRPRRNTTNETLRIRWDVLVGADGANSTVRRDVMGATAIPMADLGRIYGVTINAQTTPMRLGGVKYRPSETDRRRLAAAGVQHDYRFFRTQYGHYYVGIVLRESDARRMMATIKRGVVPAELERQTQSICKLVNAQCKRVELDQITIFPIDVTRASKFIDESANAYLVGDAVVATHFFTGSGINVGFKTAETLVEQLLKAPLGKVDKNAFNEAMTSSARYILERVYQVTTSRPKAMAAE